MKIGNENIDTNYQVACIVCGSKTELHNKAHRNKSGNITGFIFSCEKCDLKDTEFGIWDAKSGNAII